LGEFDDAEFILTAPFGDEFSKAVAIIRNLIQRRDRFVSKMNFDE